jgi:hypothetical protein
MLSFLIFDVFDQEKRKIILFYILHFRFFKILEYVCFIILKYFRGSLLSYSRQEDSHSISLRTTTENISKNMYKSS